MKNETKQDIKLPLNIGGEVDKELGSMSVMLSHDWKIQFGQAINIATGRLTARGSQWTTTDLESEIEIVLPMLKAVQLKYYKQMYDAIMKQKAQYTPQPLDNHAQPSNNQPDIVF